MLYGMWSQMPWRLCLTPAYFRWLQSLRFDMVGFMIDAVDRSPVITTTVQRAQRALELSDQYGIKLIWVTWPWPDRVIIDAQLEALRPILSLSPPAYGWERDKERNWFASVTAGFDHIKVESDTMLDGVPILPTKRVSLGRVKTPFDVAGDYESYKSNQLCQEFDLRSGITTVPGHTESSPRADTDDVQHVNVQAYSVDERDDLPIPFRHAYGPGNMQNLALNRMFMIPRVANGDATAGVGLPLWKQRFMDRGTMLPPAKAMQCALDAVCTPKNQLHQVSEVWYWADKFVYPESRFYDSHAEAFLRERA